MAEMERYKPLIAPIAAQVAERYADETFTQTLQKLGFLEVDSSTAPKKDTQTPTPKPAEGTLSLDFKRFLKSAQLSDMHFLVEGQQIPAHRAIVASRSSHFNRSLQSGMRETSEREIVVSDVSLGCFDLLLDYLYGSVDLESADVELVIELLKVCDEYNIPALKDMCGELLRTHVDVENAASLLAIADSGQAANLRNVVLEFIVENPDVETTEEYLGLEERLKEEVAQTRMQYDELRVAHGVRPLSSNNFFSKVDFDLFLPQFLVYPHDHQTS